MLSLTCYASMMLSLLAIVNSSLHTGRRVDSPRSLSSLATPPTKSRPSTLLKSGSSPSSLLLPIKFPRRLFLKRPRSNLRFVYSFFFTCVLLILLNSPRDRYCPHTSLIIDFIWPLPFECKKSVKSPEFIRDSNTYLELANRDAPGSRKRGRDDLGPDSVSPHVLMHFLCFLCL